MGPELSKNSSETLSSVLEAMVEEDLDWLKSFLELLFFLSGGFPSNTDDCLDVAHFH